MHYVTNLLHHMLLGNSIIPISDGDQYIQKKLHWTVNVILFSWLLNGTAFTWNANMHRY